MSDTHDNSWLLATTGASLCWAVADILCDMCIEEGDEEDGMQYELMKLEHRGSDMDMNLSEVESGMNDGSDDEGSRKKDEEESPGNMQDGDDVHRHNHRQQDEDDHVQWEKQEMKVKKRRTGSNPEQAESLVRRMKVADENGGAMVHVQQSGPISASEADDHDDNKKESAEDDGMTGVQDCAIAGMTTGMVMYVMSFQRIHLWNTMRLQRQNSQATYYTEAGPVPVRFIWSASEDLEWWMAAIAGALMFAHYFYLLKAFDSAPSTVINPLIQLASTWVLFGSAVPAAITGTTYIRPFDFLCYCIIVVGGILPSIDGNMKVMLYSRFWKQEFVKNTVLSEIAVGIYDLIMSYSLQHSGKKEKFRMISPVDLQSEFFFIAWAGFVVSFCFVYGLIPVYRQAFIDLRNIPPKILILSSFGQLLTLFGYYLAQYAYSWFYQASIVHAAEASLSQALNLLFALVAYRCFGIGRESAIANLKVKIISCIIVSVGLFMLSISESMEDEVEHVNIKTSDVLDLEKQLDLGVLPAP